MKHNKAATITSGIDARNPPTLPVCKAETLLGTCGTKIRGYHKKQRALCSKVVSLIYTPSAKFAGCFSGN